MSGDGKSHAPADAALLSRREFTKSAVGLGVGLMGATSLLALPVQCGQTPKRGGRIKVAFKTAAQRTRVTRPAPVMPVTMPGCSSSTTG
jgi:hypothetical protein